MDTAVVTGSSTRYAKCIEASKRVRWDIDRDVIRGRSFDLGRGLARVGSRRVVGRRALGRVVVTLDGEAERFAPLSTALQEMFGNFGHGASPPLSPRGVRRCRRLCGLSRSARP